MLVERAEVGTSQVDVRIGGGRVEAIGPSLRPRPGETVVDAAGGALLPGLHDHHTHVLSLAAALDSVHCGPPQVRDRDALAKALAAASGRWVRGIGYHESVAGRLDRHALDALVGDRPVRVQHRSGALWVVNSAGARALGLPDDHDGRLVHADAWLRERLGPGEPPDLARVGALLASFGVTAVTDATPDDGSRAPLLGSLPQHVGTMTAPGVPGGRPVKVLLEEDRLPSLDELAGTIAAAHGAARSVAVHCVTRVQLALTLAAFDAAGSRGGDRIEHASVVPPEATTELARLGLTVVTQPNFLAERGDEYVTDVDPDDLPWLYRVRGLLEAGVRVLGSTDAPFGGPDPWRAMAAAVERRTPRGRVLGRGERVTPEQALRLFTDGRQVRHGAPADLCLLRVPWSAARLDLSSDLVAATIVAGRLI